LSYFGRFLNPDEMLASIDAVRPEQLQAVAQEFFQPNLVGMSALGPLNNCELPREELAD